MADPGIELVAAHEAAVGAITVRRVLPRRGVRTVGAWCFADHMGPVSVTESAGLDVGPHPHIGLQTVTWLVAGAALHRDSLGSEQPIRPGQLNLMTAGHGVVHAEEATGTYRGTLEGVQLWVAQPDATRSGPAAFEHHAALPGADVGAARLTVLTGSFAGATSPARQDTPLVGVEVALSRGVADLPLRPDFEYAALVIRGSVELTVDRGGASGASVVTGPGRLAVLRDTAQREPGQSLRLRADAPALLLLLGGAPVAAPLMWWNFVARDRGEIEAAYAAWRDGDEQRFPDPGSRLARIPAPTPPWLSRRGLAG